MIEDTYTCPICKNKVKISLDANEELHFFEDHCPHCNVELTISAWINNGVMATLSVKPHNLVLKWVENANGDLVLHRQGQPIESSVIPKVMLNYSDISDGKEIKVDVEGLKKHIEKIYSEDV